DSALSNSTQLWDKFDIKTIQSLLLSCDLPSDRSKAKDVLVFLDNENCIPTINMAHHASINIEEGQGYDLSVLFNDVAFNHKTGIHRDIKPSDFASIIGKKRFCLLEAYDNESEYQQACKTLDSYFKGIS